MCQTSRRQQELHRLEPYFPKTDNCEVANTRLVGRMKKRANLVIVRPGSFEELEGVEIITIGNGRPGSGTVSFEHHLYRWSSIFRTLAILRRHIVANSRLADLLNKARLSCHRQARWFLVPGKWEARSRGKFYSSTRSFVSRYRGQF